MQLLTHTLPPAFQVAYEFLYIAAGAVRDLGWSVHFVPHQHLRRHRLLAQWLDCGPGRNSECHPNHLLHRSYRSGLRVVGNWDL